MRPAPLAASLAALALVACSSGDLRLAVPPVGTGFQITTPRFDVPQGMEVERCFYVEIPPAPGGTPTWYVHSIESGVNVGTHDVALYAASDAWVAANVALPLDPTVSHDCTNVAPGADMTLIYAEGRATASSQRWTLPGNVAFRLVAHHWVVLRARYANTASQATPVAGRVTLNLYQLAGADATTPLACALYARDTTLSLPASGPSTVSATCALPSDAASAVSVLGVAGHTHPRGTHVTVRAPDGTVLLDDPSPAASPAFATYDLVAGVPDGGVPDGGLLPAVPQLHPGDALAYQCDYVNTTGAPLAYGPSVETNEQCSIVAYVTPCPPEGVVYCL